MNMQKRLSELGFGESGTVREILASPHDLNCLGIRAGKHLTMITRQPIRGPVVVAVEGIEVAMGLETARSVIVERDCT